MTPAPGTDPCGMVSTDQIQYSATADQVTFKTGAGRAQIFTREQGDATACAAAGSNGAIRGTDRRYSQWLASSAVPVRGAPRPSRARPGAER